MGLDGGPEVFEVCKTLVFLIFDFRLRLTVVFYPFYALDFVFLNFLVLELPDLLDKLREVEVGLELVEIFHEHAHFLVAAVVVELAFELGLAVAFCKTEGLCVVRKVLFLPNCLLYEVVEFFVFHSI